MEIENSLDLLEKALPHLPVLNWKFSSDPEHDSRLIRWFAHGGSIRSSYEGRTSSKEERYLMQFRRGEVKINLGMICFYAQRMTLRDDWKSQYLKEFWLLNDSLTYALGLSLETLEERMIKHGQTKIDDTTFAYRDGSFSKNNALSQCKDSSIKSIEKHRLQITELLNRNAYPYWEEMKEKGMSHSEFCEKHKGIVASYKFGF